MFSRFIGGRSIASLSRRIKKLDYKPIIDYVGEHGNFIKENKKCVSHFKNSFVSLKLTGLGLPNTDNAYNNCYKICSLAKNNNNKILIDAENFKSKEQIDLITDQLVKDFNKNSNILVYKTIQAYYKDSLKDLDNFLTKHNDNLGVKLVRGAYISEDSKYNVLCDSIEHTHFNYNKSIKVLSEYKKKNNTDVIIATHNSNSCLLGQEFDDINNSNNRFKYAQLLGMADKLSRDLKNSGEDVYKYIPYGEYTKSIPYLTRRLIENYKIMQYLFT